jgi:hypothetical protein
MAVMPAGPCRRLAEQDLKQIALTRQTGEGNCASVSVGEQWATRRSSLRVKGLEGAALDESGYE